MNKYVYYILAVVAITAVNVGITRYMLDQQAVKFAGVLQTPKILVLNELALNRQLQRQASGTQKDPAQVLADRQNLITALSSQNYMVISDNLVAGYPMSTELSDVNMAEVMAYLTKNNLPVSMASEHANSVMSASEYLEKQMSNFDN